MHSCMPSSRRAAGRTANVAVMRAVPALLGVALVLSLASLAYQQIRTQRQRDAEAIANLRRQLVEAEQAKLAALLQLKEAQAGLSAGGRGGGRSGCGGSDGGQVDARGQRF